MGVTGLFVSLDQLTKIIVHTQMELHQTIPVIQNFFHITYVRNFGAAFGFLSQAPAAFRDVFFLAVPPIAGLIILFMLKGVDNKDTRQTLALSSIFAGAMGNYMDRLHYGFVVDFFDFHYGRLSWPAFNIADMAIVLGVIFLLYTIFKESRTRST